MLRRLEGISATFDVAVIGGGPAGMMAAGRAGELGAKVVLIEKNKSLGRKLLLTGKGRCNLTQAEFDTRKLVEEYGKNGDFLYSPFSVFGVKETIKFFEDKGLKVKIERGKRIFPVSDKAEDVLRALANYLKESKVTIMYNSEVLDFEKENNRMTRVILKDREITAANYIICTGGKSYPVTGSTGDGFRWARELGHQVIEPRPALVPIKIKEKWLSEAKGLSLKNVEISVCQNNKKQASRFGEALFTHFGLSGPIVLDISKKVGELIKNGEVSTGSPSEVKLRLDLKPALNFETLNKRIQRDFEKYTNKVFKNSLTDLLPQKLIPIIIKLSGLGPEKIVNQITREERYDLVRLLKGLELTVTDLLGFEEAIITTGGISLKEIESKTMKSKIIKNLFFAGEIIDIDGPSGGYNLQVCWTTGYIAGTNAAKR